ncbi:hypothetical protein [Kitasatospora sp. NPDC004272]
MHTDPAQPTAVAESGLLLPPGYITALDPATGQLVAIRTQEQPLPIPAVPAAQPAAEPGLLERAQRYAAEQPDPIPATAPPAWQGVSPVVGQAVVLGGIASMGMLAAGGAVYLACGGLQMAGPWLNDATRFLGGAALLLVTAAAVAALAVRKLKAKTTTTGDGTVVNALFHRHTEMHVGKQSAGWKGSVTNNVK